MDSSRQQSGAEALRLPSCVHCLACCGHVVFHTILIAPTGLAGVQVLLKVTAAYACTWQATYQPGLHQNWQLLCGYGCRYVCILRGYHGADVLEMLPCVSCTQFNCQTLTIHKLITRWSKDWMWCACLVLCCNTIKSAKHGLLIVGYFAPACVSQRVCLYFDQYSCMVAAPICAWVMFSCCLGLIRRMFLALGYICEGRVTVNSDVVIMILEGCLVCSKMHTALGCWHRCSLLAWLQCWSLRALLPSYLHSVLMLVPMAA